MEYLPVRRSTAVQAPDISQYYSIYSDELQPLSNFNSSPEGLTAVAMPNGDILLQTADGQEAVFDVIAVTVASCLEAPQGFSKFVCLKG
jgi:hypothetical protein